MRLVLGGTASGAGKTSVCIALAAGLGKRGLRISGFKAGPDYLDPMYIKLATARPCYNLDPWMSDQAHILDLVADAPGLALVEGVMGYYDGAEAADSFGSTAHLAGMLNSQALLVANARAMARSFGALVSGFVHFEDQGQRIKGIVANNCNSIKHADILSRALESAGLPPLAGALPGKAFPEFSSRHLGLKVPDDSDGLFLDKFADAAEKYLDLDMIIRLAGQAGSLSQRSSEPQKREVRARIGVARDRAFNFYYQANLDALESAGAELEFFSPLKDRVIPEKLDLLYLGGGYPELYAYELSQNKSLRNGIQEYARSGGHIYAECGGLVYLCRDLKILNDQVFPMAGVLPFKAIMLSRRKSLGYVQVSLLKECVLGQSGKSFRGHEYHYSEVIPENETGWENIYHTADARGKAAGTLGILSGNVLASYAHAYFGHRLDLAERIIEWIAK